MDDEIDIDIHSDERCRSRERDRAIARLAERQHGVVSRRQLVETGLGRGAIDYRIRHGRLHGVYRGVYAVGHPLLSQEGRWMAAVLAGGPGALLSHRAAAAHWKMLPPGSGEPEVIVRRSCRGIRGVTVRRATPAPDEVTVLDGIPVTGVSRTIFDLAATEPPRTVERAINEADYLRLTDVLSLPVLIGRYPVRRGSSTVKTILGERNFGATRTRSELEEAFLAFIDEEKLPRPRMNEWLLVRGRWIEADAVWHRARIIVELDSHSAHGTRAAFECDRERDRATTLARWRVVRVTWQQLHEDRAALAADLRALLAADLRALRGPAGAL